MVDERIHIGFADDDLVIIPEGHITSAYCPVLKRSVMQSLNSERPVHCLRFDLAGCDYMDSTFLGLIVLFSKATESKGIGKPVFHNVNDSCMSLFRTMGILSRLEFSAGACPLPPKLETMSTSDTLTAQIILETHKELSLISPENEERFRQLTRFLENSLE